MAMQIGQGRERVLSWVGGVMVALMVLAALAAPWLAPFDPLKAVAPSFGDPAPPGLPFLLGTDELGRDVLSRLLYGARVSLLVATVATTMTLVIGVAVGVSAGYLGGWVDTALMRLTDVVLAFPALLLAIALAALFEPGLGTIFVVIGVVSWTGVARTVRGEVLSLRERDYLTAARALGSWPGRLMLRHVIPNVLPTIIVMGALSTSNTVLLDAGLSYLGLGVPVPTPSWGRMISDSQTYYRLAPWLMISPGLAIVYAVAAFNFLGYGLLARFGRRDGGS
ncbi:MAG TPA: ABC transporter permease [Candidatus Margulisiibacteriota bacterium]|nr:ABC transporter permease [Candidatus Margulisiibacteriota bacterium]